MRDELEKDEYLLDEEEDTDTADEGEDEDEDDVADPLADEEEM